MDEYDDTCESLSVCRMPTPAAPTAPPSSLTPGSSHSTLSGTRCEDLDVICQLRPQVEKVSQLGHQVGKVSQLRLQRGMSQLRLQLGKVSQLWLQLGEVRVSVVR